MQQWHIRHVKFGRVSMQVDRRLVGVWSCLVVVIFLFKKKQSRWHLHQHKNAVMQRCFVPQPLSCRDAAIIPGCAVSFMRAYQQKGRVSRQVEACCKSQACQGCIARQATIQCCDNRQICQIGSTSC